MPQNIEYMEKPTKKRLLGIGLLAGLGGVITTLASWTKMIPGGSILIVAGVGLAFGALAYFFAM